MANITAVVDTFLSTLAGLHDEHLPLDDILQPALNQEHSLRKLFVTDRGNHFLQNPYIGLIDVFNIPHEVRRARPRLWDDPEQDFVWSNQNAQHTFPKQFIAPVVVGMRRPRGEPCIVEDLATFQDALGIFSYGVLSAISDWSNIVIAGGSVLACLSSFSVKPSRKELKQIYQSDVYKMSDIDLFMWGLTEEQAKHRMEDIFNSIDTSLLWDAVCFRKKNTITIHGNFPMRPLQIVMRLYQSPAEILAGFDVDCSCFAYDGETVFTNPRGLTSCIRQCNTIDLSRRSPSYEARLNKYSIRGFEIYYPTLDRNRINYSSLSDPERKVFPRGLGRLIVLEIMDLDYRNFQYLYEQPDDAADHSAPVPIESLRPSNYNYAWVRIPYGDKWRNISNLEEYVNYLGDRIIGALRWSGKLCLNSHNHVVSSGTMTDCLASCCRLYTCEDVENADVENADVENAEVENEDDLHSALFRGPAVFIQDDPGRQLIGSFDPRNHDDWEADAYLVEDAN